MLNQENKLILVIEDDKSLRDALLFELRKEGFSTDSAVNGQEGLDKIKLKKPDLVLLDLVMPIMDGITMLERLREEDDYKSLPVIMLTNLNEAEQLEYALAYGVKDYLVKSDWKIADVMAKIKAKLSIV